MKFLHFVSFVSTLLLFLFQETTSHQKNSGLTEKGPQLNNGIFTRNRSSKGKSTSCQCGIRKPSFGIINGERTVAGEYPWQVALQEEVGEGHICGGVVIHPEWVLTANHCPVPNSAKVIAGSNNLRRQRNQQIRNVARVIGYEQESWHSNDIKLVQVDTEFEFNDYVTPICLPFNLEDETFENKIVEASGWGRFFRRSYISSPILYKLHTSVLSNEECSQRDMEPEILESHICAEGENVSGMCHGDSGGPLVYEVEPNRFTLVGLVSFGETMDCYKAVAYTRVTSFLDWIVTNTGINDFCKAF